MTSNITATLSAGTVAGILVGAAFMPPALAATDAAAAAATATCKAQVAEQAKYHEMSWYARHKAVKNCIKQTLAKH